MMRLPIQMLPVSVLKRMQDTKQSGFYLYIMLDGELHHEIFEATEKSFMKSCKSWRDETLPTLKNSVSDKNGKKPVRFFFIKRGKGKVLADEVTFK